MRLFLINIILFFFIFISCNFNNRNNFFNDKILKKNLDQILIKYTIDENGKIIRNAALSIDSPRYDFKYQIAYGLGRADTGEKMTTDHQFNISSVGKTITAVIILQLWEEGFFGKNGLDATLYELNIFPQEVIKELHYFKGKSYGQDITIRHLLTHTSGVKDLLYDDENGTGDQYPQFKNYAPNSLNGIIIFDKEKGAEASIDFIEKGIPENAKKDDFYLFHKWNQWSYEAWKKNPKNRFAGLLNFYLSSMNKTALFPPGKGFHYTDTDYIILGLLIEKLTDKSLHRNLRERIFDPLKMKFTFLNYSDDPPTKEWETRLSDQWCMNKPLMSYGFNLSMDWSAGGEISTLEDMNIFIKALASGKLFKNKKTLDEMKKYPEGINGPSYALGIIAWKTGKGLIFHHNGSSGAWMEYHTVDDLSVIGTINDIDKSDNLNLLRADIYKALNDAGMKNDYYKYIPNGIYLMNIIDKKLSILLIILAIFSILTFITIIFIYLPVKLFINYSNLKFLNYLSFFIALYNLLFLILFFIQIVLNPIQMMFGFSEFTRRLLYMPVFGVIAVIIQLISMFIVWMKSYWGIIERIYYTIITLAGISYIYLLYILKILIF